MAPSGGQGLRRPHKDRRSPWLELALGYGPGAGVLKPSYGVPAYGNVDR